MPLFGHHLFGSDFHAGCSDAEFRAGLTLWWAAWNQVPAASLPNDDIVLCRLAELGRDLKAWRKVRAKAMHGFEVCSDGRFYHRFLAEQAIVAWDKRVKERERKRKWRESRPTTEGEWRELRLSTFKRDGFKCVKCGATEDLEADHIVPVDQGGATTLSNLQTLCKPCNASKRNGIPRRAPSLAFDADATGTGRGRDASVPAEWNRRDVTGIDGTGIDGTMLRTVPPAQARTAPKAKAVGEGTPDQQAARATWTAYSAAYLHRYGVEPVRNKTINSHVIAFVRRVPHAEAPDVAAFFVSHKGQRYVAAMHPTNLMLQDAEKLRTEWATGRQVTSTSARQSDRTAAIGDAVSEYLHDIGVSNG